jgi:nitrite reductase/ring-hydroxylating ferredoxin subunit
VDGQLRSVGAGSSCPGVVTDDEPFAQSTNVFDACSLDALAAHGRLSTVLPTGEAVLLLLLGTGLYAVRNECPHLGLPLDEAEVSDRSLRCAWHGRAWDLASGRCLSSSRGKSENRLGRYRAWLESGRVTVAPVPTDDCTSGGSGSRVAAVSQKARRVVEGRVRRARFPEPRVS